MTDERILQNSGDKTPRVSFSSSYKAGAANLFAAVFDTIDKMSLLDMKCGKLFMLLLSPDQTIVLQSALALP